MPSTALTLFAVAIGGASGALCRYAVGFWALRLSISSPLGTLLVNATGAFFIGLLFALLVERELLPDFWRALLMVGFLGALTTFSAFSLELLQMLQRGEWLAAVAYSTASVILCLALTYAGVELGRALSSLSQMA